jgi:hypothetical protein
MKVIIAGLIEFGTATIHGNTFNVAFVYDGYETLDLTKEQLEVMDLDGQDYVTDEFEGTVLHTYQIDFTGEVVDK